MTNESNQSTLTVELLSKYVILYYLIFALILRVAN